MVRSEKGDTEEIKELERELQDKSLLLANLEVMIEDYRREKSKLIEELMCLREKLWDLTGQQRDSESRSDITGD
jgi:chromosome segregation ATPase